jgi:hypothetical protein
MDSGGGQAGRQFITQSGHGCQNAARLRRPTHCRGRRLATLGAQKNETFYLEVPVIYIPDRYGPSAPRGLSPHSGAGGRLAGKLHRDHAAFKKCETTSKLPWLSANSS